MQKRTYCRLVCSLLKGVFAGLAFGWLMISWISKVFLPFPELMQVSLLPKIFVQTLWLILNSCFLNFFCKSSIGVCTRQKVTVIDRPNNNLRLIGSGELLLWITFHTCFDSSVAGGFEHILYGSTKRTLALPGLAQ